MGGRVFDPITGGSHTAPEVLQFMRDVLTTPTTTGAEQSSRVKNAYGATEFPGISANGEVSDAVDLELVDVPDMGFSAADTPYPRGEIRVRHRGGRKPLTGYWRNDEETRKVFRDGWYYTGGQDDTDVRMFPPLFPSVPSRTGRDRRRCSDAAYMYTQQRRVHEAGLLYPVVDILLSRCSRFQVTWAC